MTSKLFIISRNGTRREPTATELEEISGGVMKTLLMHKFNPKILAIMVVLAGKRMLNRTYNERHMLTETALDMHHIEIECNEKTLTLPFGGDLWFPLFTQIFIKSEYCLEESDIRGKTIIDAGANIGAFSLYCACMGAKKVHAFEPVKETYEGLLRNIRANNLQGTITAYNYGLGEKAKTAMIKCDYAGDAGASMETRKHQRKNEQQVEITSIDLLQLEPDVIKIDTEGYEENILNGATKTIREYGPILTLSAYHKLTDRESLPRKIKEIDGRYECIMNRRYEEVLTCRRRAEPLRREKPIR